MKKQIFIILSLILVLALVLGACAPKKEKAETTEPSVEKKAENKDEKKPEGASSEASKGVYLVKSVDGKYEHEEFKTNFLTWILEQKQPVLIDFYADWCGPCKMAAPVIDELSKEYKDKALVVKVDTDVAREVAQAFSIQSLPTFAVYKGGEVKHLSFGIPPGYEDKLRNALNVELD